MNTIVNVRQMGLQDRGVIRAVSARGELGHRIRDMGLVPGTEISVVGRAPLRDPVALRLRDYTLTLRNSEADYISVELFFAERSGRRGARHGAPGESSQGCGGCRARNPPYPAGRCAWHGWVYQLSGRHDDRIIRPAARDS